MKSITLIETIRIKNNTFKINVIFAGAEAYGFANPYYPFFVQNGKKFKFTRGQFQFRLIAD